MALARGSGMPESKSKRKPTADEPSLTDRFQPIAKAVTDAAGSIWAMGIAALVVIGWLLSGPFFGYSDTWQLVINTGTTIVTFLMVFAIQATQNRSSRAMQIKLDELIRATRNARNVLIDEEDELEDEIQREEARMKRVRAKRGGSSK
jgi:low affinity Fe/Cu permease